MISPALVKIDKEGLKAAPGSVEIGNTVSVRVKIREGDKERVQVFKGIVIGRRGSGATETFTVRRVSHGVGVERVFPVHSPYVEQIVVERVGHARRAKLHYLRERVGKSARLRDRTQK